LLPEHSSLGPGVGVEISSILAGRGSAIRWRTRVEDYIEMCRSSGLKLVDAKKSLIQFAPFLEQSRTTHITIALAMK
jgi:hypothetical protein